MIITDKRGVNGASREVLRAKREITGGENMRAVTEGSGCDGHTPGGRPSVGEASRCLSMLCVEPVGEGQ